ncbi:MAG: lysylphosphatidylglycerol synthase domain-containing protein, partial [Bacteroidota bacterium]
MIQWIKKHIKVILSVIIIGLVAYFFTTEFKKNWQDILAMNLRLNLPLLAGSVFFMLVAYLGNTATWRYLINSFHPELPPISIKESVAIVNTTQLAKYIPGKVWSYAVQIYWLSKRGYPKSNVFFINLVATLSTLMAASAVGIIMLSFTLDKVSKTGAFIIISIVIVAYAIFILFHTPILNVLIKLAAKLLKKEISYVKISLTSIFMTQVYYVVSNLFFCFGGYLLCYAIGITDDFHVIVCVVGSLLVGDVVGFVVLVTPGGLGVREIMMTFIISGMAAASKEVAIVVPIA